MIVHLMLRGALRQAASSPDGRTAVVQVALGASVAEVLRVAGVSTEQVWRVARDGEFVDLGEPTCEGDELVLFPPLGGG